MTSAEVRRCLAAATKGDDLDTCAAKLSAEQKAKLKQATHALLDEHEAADKQRFQARLLAKLADYDPLFARAPACADYRQAIVTTTAGRAACAGYHSLELFGDEQALWKALKELTARTDDVSEACRTAAAALRGWHCP
jgi:hypothetical protein